MSKTKGTCGLVILRDGVPGLCGGKLIQRKIHEPFTMQSVIGSPIATLFSYLTCQSCRVVFEQGAAEEIEEERESTIPDDKYARDYFKDY